MKNEWQIRYDAKRRAIDKTILQECEHRIEAEEKAAKSVPSAINPVPHRNTVVGSFVDNDARAAIAKAFGRPLA